MSNQPVRIVGDGGPSVVLLAGGAESVSDFFPGLVDELVSNRRCRVVLYDRPGVGSNATPGQLSGASVALHAMLETNGFGPAVLIGQSLGGAAALLLARDYPEDVAGLVLLDPSLVNDVKLAKSTERAARAAAFLCRVPLVEKLFDAQFRSYGAKLADRHNLSSDDRSAFAQAAAVDIPKLREAVQGLAEIAQDFRESDLPRVPSAVVTADRKKSSKVFRAHARLAEALGAHLHQWPGAEHAVHLTNPSEVVDVCRQVLGEVDLRT